MKKNNIFIKVFLLVIFFACYVAWLEEFKIRDQYRFIEQMPLKWLNYSLCIGIILAIFIYSCLPVRKSKIMLILLALIIVLITATSVKNYMYYSKEINILKQDYEELILEDDMEKLLKKKNKAYIYVDAVDKTEKWTDSQKIYEAVKKYFYKMQKQFYVFRPLNDEAYEYLETLELQELPVLIVINEKGIIEFYYNDSILKHLELE